MQHCRRTFLRRGDQPKWHRISIPFKQAAARVCSAGGARRHVEDEREAARVTQQFTVDDPATSEKPEEE